MKTTRHERRDWVIIIAIILIGFLCLLLAGWMSVRLSPSWELEATMGSNIDPNSDFLTNRPVGFIEPVDAAILTPPIWIDLIFTPGAIVPTRSPFITTTPVPTLQPGQPTSTRTGTPTVTATSSLVFIPSKTSTTNPAFTKTASSTPSQTASPTRTFTPTPSWTPTATPTSTSTYTPTSTFTPTSTATFTPTSTPTVPPQADLRITITDGATDYEASASVRYIIRASNPSGPSPVTGATVTSAFSPNLTGITWSCLASSGASCTASGSGNINDTLVNIPVGGTVTYTVLSTAIASPSGALVSSASIAPPGTITETAWGDNSATDTDQLIVSSTFPYGNIDPFKDGFIEFIPTDTVVTLQFTSPLTVGSHAGYDLVYYEFPQGTGIWMDCVILQLGDGQNWYTFMNWCDNVTDTNASMNMSTIGAAAETDNLPIDAAFMFNTTGIQIELDGVVPNGIYKYIRIISPPVPPDDGDGVEVDAIVVLP